MNFFAKLCVFIACVSILLAEQKAQNMESACREKIELICIGDDALSPKFVQTMEDFIALARERYSKEMACDPLYEAKLRYYIESEEKDVLVYMLDEELVYLERHINDVSIREKLWKKYFLDADGYMAELDHPIIFFWLLFSDAVPASIYREAWMKYFRGDVDKLKTGNVMLSPKDMYEDYFKNIRDRLVPLAGNHGELKKNPEANSAYRTEYYHNFKEFVKHQSTKAPEFS